MTPDDTAFWLELLEAVTAVLWGLSLLAWLRARAAREQLRTRPFARAGERAVLLTGVVAPTLGEPADRAPIVLTITQTSAVHARHIRWTERGRTLHARPFDLVCATGQRVRVDPGSDVVLARSLGAPMPTDDHAARTRSATLPLGAETAVYGSLYRELVPSATGAHARDGSAVGLCLRAPLGAPLTVFQGAPDALFTRRARTHRNVAALGTVGIFVALGAFADGPASLVRPTDLSPDGAAFAVIVMLVMAAEYAWLFARTRPWYERARLDEVEPARFGG